MLITWNKIVVFSVIMEQNPIFILNKNYEVGLRFTVTFIID